MGLDHDLWRAFEHHKLQLGVLVKRRVEEVQIESVAHDTKKHKLVQAYGSRYPSDKYKGDAALRDIVSILKSFDTLG